MTTQADSGSEATRELTEELRDELKKLVPIALVDDANGYTAASFRVSDEVFGSVAMTRLQDSDFEIVSLHPFDDEVVMFVEHPVLRARRELAAAAEDDESIPVGKIEALVEDCERWADAGHETTYANMADEIRDRLLEGDDQ